MNHEAQSKRLSVTYLPVSSLVENRHNARTHRSHQVGQIEKSIYSFGFNNPVLIDSKNVVIAGHGRLAAAKRLGMPEVPTIRIEGLTEDEIRAFMIADNRTAEKAGWDEEILSVEFQHIIANAPHLDITLTGFEMGEIDLIIGESKNKAADSDGLVDVDTSGPQVTQLTDHWKLGPHHLLCGNALSQQSFHTLLGNKKADLVFTDPPFNLKIDGHVSGNGRIHHHEFAMASGEMSEAEFVAFLNTSLGLLSKYSTANSIQYICMDWRHMGELLAVGRQLYASLQNVCVWAKNNAGMGSFYRSQHELIFVFQNGRGRYRNNVQLGQFGRNRSNVWNYPNANTFSKQTDEGNLLALHPTVKPVAMVADAILDCSARGDIVFDSFLGSGTTLMAAERVGRMCYGLELDPHYVDVVIRRWQRLTGEQAIHAVSGERFNDVGEKLGGAQ